MKKLALIAALTGIAPAAQAGETRMDVEVCIALGDMASAMVEARLQGASKPAMQAMMRGIGEPGEILDMFMGVIDVSFSDEIPPRMVSVSIVNECLESL